VDNILLLHFTNGGGDQVNPDLRNLIALQDLELSIARLQKQSSEIPGKTQILENELARIRDEYDREVSQSKDLVNQRRHFEGEVEVLQTKLSRLKDQLMTVKTNKEYTAMLHEIQAAEGQIRSEEDKILDIMEKTEDMDQVLKKAGQEMLKKSAETQEEIRKTTESAPQMENELTRLQEEKNRVEKTIGEELLARYRRIAKACKGVALAEAKEELCSACHVRIRPQMYAELLKTDNIYACDSCSRILFHRDNA
jgi:predicted  nucleic acid-binding Zn-ribbon protein